jgi:hypothetical protein
MFNREARLNCCQAVFGKTAGKLKPGDKVMADTKEAGPLPATILYQEGGEPTQYRIKFDDGEESTFEEDRLEKTALRDWKSIYSGYSVYSENTGEVYDDNIGSLEQARELAVQRMKEEKERWGETDGMSIFDNERGKRIEKIGWVGEKFNKGDEVRVTDNYHHISGDGKKPSGIGIVTKVNPKDVEDGIIRVEFDGDERDFSEDELEKVD